MWFMPYVAQHNNGCQSKEGDNRAKQWSTENDRTSFMGTKGKHVRKEIPKSFYCV